MWPTLPGVADRSDCFDVIDGVWRETSIVVSQPYGYGVAWFGCETWLRFFMDGAGREVGDKNETLRFCVFRVGRHGG